MSPRLRKVALTAHVTASVGWLGAVGAFLALAIAGVTSANAQMARSAYLAMEPVTQFIIVPLAAGSLLTGVISSLGTPWGLFRHYWVVVKFVVTLLATAVLLLQLEPIRYVAAAAAQAPLSSVDLWQERISLVAHAGGGLLVLLVPTVLGVFKPRGMTGYGRRKERQLRSMAQPSGQ